LEDLMTQHDERSQAVSATMVFRAFLRLGLTSFGGPVAHLGFFRSDLVERRGWLSERDYADLVALCQFLPGPASSQVGIGIGLMKAGLPGAFAAWLGFTLPSALALIAFGLGLVAMGEGLPPGVLKGLKIVAVAVVAQAVWAMAGALAPDRPRATFAVLGAVAILLLPSSLTTLAVIASGGLAGLALLPRSKHGGTQPAMSAPVHRSLSPRFALGCLGVFFAMLAGLPVLAGVFASPGLDRADAFFRVGSLVFGGGHVVLPLLQGEVVKPGLVDEATFLAGYGAAQAVPGPLFTFVAFLGTVMQTPPAGIAGGLLALVAVFAPSFLLVFGAIPFWSALKALPRARAALDGINAVVVGILLAALYDPVFTSAIAGPNDFALALIALLALTLWKVPAWLAVGAMALAGWVIS
jgi:chromate transporter